MDKFTLSELATRYTMLKLREDEAKAERIEVEEIIASKVKGKDEGVSHGYDGIYDVTVTRKMNRTIDKEKYMAVKDSIDGIDPVKMKPTLDLKRLRSIQETAPKVYKICTQFITTKPAKVAVKMEVRKDEGI